MSETRYFDGNTWDDGRSRRTGGFQEERPAAVVEVQPTPEKPASTEADPPWLQVAEEIVRMALVAFACLFLLYHYSQASH
jgi:hypothetical protein